MSSIASSLDKIYGELAPFNCQLIAVSKTYPVQSLEEALAAGQLDFGENKVQELVEKHEQLPSQIRWHLIGHLQTNKVKYIAPFVYLIHSVDSLKLLKEINKEALKNNVIIKCLLQIYIAQEDTKFGFSFEEAESMMLSEDVKAMNNISIQGFMGMATNTANQDQIRTEFQSLKNFNERLRSSITASNIQLVHLSMGMSGDYLMACEEGSTMVRIGSSIFGRRD